MAAKKKKAAKKTARKAAAKRPAARRVERRVGPLTLRIKSVGAGLTVNDIHQSIAWYTEVLGFVAGEKWEKDGKLMGIEIKSGATAFWLGQDDWAKGRDRVKGAGMRLYCNTEQDVFALAKAIQERGGKLDHEPETRSWGGTDFGITDPDGYKLTIQSL